MTPPLICLTCGRPTRLCPGHRRAALDAIIRREGDEHRDRLRLMRADHAARRHAGTRCDGTCEN